MADFTVLDHQQHAALKEFIGTVFLMRQAQAAFNVVPSGSHLRKKRRFEKEVDDALELLITPQVREEWQKRKEVSNG